LLSYDYTNSFGLDKEWGLGGKKFTFDDFVALADAVRKVTEGRIEFS
jgi:hypothetical protein